MSAYRMNVRKDAYDARDRVMPPVLLKAPVHVDFRHEVPYIKDQGQEGSCTGHAGTENFERAVRVFPSDVPASFERNKIRLSPQFVYAMERIDAGAFDVDGGSDSRTLFKVMTKYGGCLEAEDAYCDQKCFEMPTPAQITEAKNFRFGAYHRIQDVDTAKSVLLSGYTFVVGTPLYEQFESDECSCTGMVAVPGTNDNEIGGHEMHIVGAQDDFVVHAAGQMHTGAFIVQNSWSDSWGAKGFCFMPYAYFDTTQGAWDMWVAHFGKPWQPKNPPCKLV